jgi:hypothetical protein
VGLGQIAQKELQDTLHQTCLSASCGICGSYSPFWCIRGAQHRLNILHAQVGLMRIPEKHVGMRYAELVILYLVGSAGHVVHSGVFRA